MKYQHLFRIVPALASVIIVQAGMERKGSFDLTAAPADAQVAVAPEFSKKGSFDLTAGGTSKGGEVPVVPGLYAGGTSKGGEVPVVPGLAKRAQAVNAGGTSKGGEVPVVPGFA